MICVKEILTSENSFFETFKKVNSTLYMFLFESDEPPIIEYSPEILDMALLVACGDRYAAPLLTHYTMEQVVEYVIAKYGDSWQRIQKAIAADYDVIKPYSVTQTTIGERAAKNETASQSEDTTKKVGFDSETGTTSDIDANTNNVNITQNETNNTTVTNSGNNGNMKFSDLVANEIEVRKNSFVSLVIKDIQTQITLDIY